MLTATSPEEKMDTNENLAVQCEMTGKLTRIFVLANPDFYLEGLLAVLSRSTDSEVVACVKPGDDCWNKFTSQPADVLLIHRQAVQNAPDGLSRFLQHAPTLKVIVFGHDMPDEFLLKVVRSGAAGYINEKMSGDHLLKAIRKVLEGELWVERHILQRLIMRVVEIEGIINQAIESIRSVLTNRESEIYRHVLGGLSTKEIASEMNLSEQSVKLHLSNIFKKFDVNNKQQLILLTFQKVCPVANVMRLFRIVMDRRQLSNGKPPLIKDPLAELSGPEGKPAIAF
jgi:two-component system, NarL family, nitrate/nitrite response regulator NarL